MKANVLKAVTIAEQYLGVPRMISPENVIQGKVSTEIMMAYYAQLKAAYESFVSHVADDAFSSLLTIYLGV